MRFVLLSFLLICSTAFAAVKTVRVPDGGIEPQAAVDAKGVIHLIYYKGPDRAGDVYYTTSADAGQTFAAPIRVNSEAGSAMATGTIRGAHLALGRNGRVHVAWMASGTSKTKAPGNTIAMLYTRLADDGKGFEEQRNVIAEHVGMDGGGSVAADDAGNVYVAWHAPSKKDGGEASRRVWVARSSDEGKTFEPEAMASEAIEGACACCSLKIFADNDTVVVAFRRATNMTERGTVLLLSTDQGKNFVAKPIDQMQSGKCIMSSFSIVKTAKLSAIGLENNGEIRVLRDGQPMRTIGNGKYPALAVNHAGEMLVARAVGTGWNKGGAVAWEIFSPDGKAGEKGDAKNLPTWSFPAAVALPDGNFLVIY